MSSLQALPQTTCTVGQLCIGHTNRHTIQRVLFNPIALHRMWKRSDKGVCQQERPAVRSGTSRLCTRKRVTVIRRCPQLCKHVQQMRCHISKQVGYSAGDSQMCSRICP